MCLSLPSNRERQVSIFSLEESFSMRNKRRRPGDIFIANYDFKGSAFLDVSIIHTLAQSQLLEDSGEKQISVEIKLAGYPGYDTSFQFWFWNPSILIQYLKFSGIENSLFQFPPIG